MRPYIEETYKPIKTINDEYTFMPVGRWIVRRKTPFQRFIFMVKRFIKTAKLSTLTEKTLSK